MKIKMKHARFVLLAVFAVATLATPLSIVWKYENTLRHGTLFKFRTQPVDPVDAFRGRYVALSFADNYVKREQPVKWNWSREDEEKEPYSLVCPQYVRLAVDADGFAKPVELSSTPLAGSDVITVERSYVKTVFQDGGVQMNVGRTVSYPFDRYYLPEDISPMAEKLYREANMRGGANSRGESRAKADTYVTVRVRNGVGVIEELYLNGVPVREAVRAQMQK